MRDLQTILITEARRCDDNVLLRDIQYFFANPNTTSPLARMLYAREAVKRGLLPQD